MNDEMVIIGISGASASGKSLLANTIFDEVDSVDINIISEDSYYRDRSDLSMAERTKINYDHPDSLEHDMLARHLTELRNGCEVEVPIYDYSAHSRAQETRKVKPTKVLILEGILLFTDECMRNKMDIKIFVDTPLDICLSRRIKRDVFQRSRTIESVLSQYEKTVRPMYLQFIEPSKRYADIIVPRGGANRIAIDMIKAKLHQLLG